MRRLVWVLAVTVTATGQAQSLDFHGSQVTWLMDGSTIIGTQVHATYPTPASAPGWLGRSLGSPFWCDLNGDGISDEVWWNERLGLVVPWVFDAAGQIVYPVVALGPIDAEWKVTGCSDTGGPQNVPDGKADIHWVYVDGPS